VSQPTVRRTDFDHPSLMFVIEDRVKSLLGCFLFYGKDIKSLGLKGDERILDFGCGGGVASRCLMRYVGKNGYVLCVDTSRYWMKVAAKRLREYPNVECRVGDIRLMNLPRGSFDVIVIFHVIHDIIPEERQPTLDVLSRLLKRQGKLFLREPVRSSHGMSIEEIHSLLVKAGLKEIVHSEDRTHYRAIFIPEG